MSNETDYTGVGLGRFHCTRYSNSSLNVLNTLEEKSIIKLIYYNVSLPHYLFERQNM